VSENRVLCRIFGLKWDDIKGKWRKLHNQELNDLYSSPNIIWVIKSRIRWAGHGARRGRGEVHTAFWWEILTERDHLQDPGIDRRIITRCTFRKWEKGHALD
jgi:hypothetical protein